MVAIWYRRSGACRDGGELVERLAEQPRQIGPIVLADPTREGDLEDGDAGGRIADAARAQR
jgi:hypothetical protein